MDTQTYNHFQSDDNDVRPPAEAVVNVRPVRPLSKGQQALLDCVPAAGDVIDLEEAVGIVTRFDGYAYGLIAILMNSGLMSADFLDAHSVDREIVLRRN